MSSVFLLTIFFILLHNIIASKFRHNLNKQNDDNNVPRMCAWLYISGWPTQDKQVAAKGSGIPRMCARETYWPKIALIPLHRIIR